MDKIYKVSEVSEYLQTSRNKMYLMIQKGLIPYVRIGRNVRIRKKDLLNWIEVNCVKFQLPDGQYVFFNPHS